MDNCKICDHEVKSLFNALILNKYKVQYYKCVNCGFIQTEPPFWLQEAYSSAITKQDVGLLMRNLFISPILSCLINHYFDRNRNFIDYGGGYGVLTRIMRDQGYRFANYDTYCENIFSKGFDETMPNECPDYELLTSFEVFEHLVDPASELEKMLKWSSNIFFSSELQPPVVNSPNDWWYIMPETGQHIAFYTAKSLQLLGEKFGLNYYTNNFNLHLFTKKKINPLLYRVIIKRRAAILLNLITSNKQSLTMADYHLILKENKKEINR